MAIHSTPAGKSVLWLLSPIVLLALTMGCGGGNQAAGKKGDGGPAPISIHTTGVVRIAIQRQVDLAGTLISPEQARVSSEVAGVVKQVLVDLGREVVPDQVLVRLEPREMEIALRRAESQLRQTEAQLGIDGVNVKEPPPDDQVAAVRTASANRDDARAQLVRAQRLRSLNLLSQADLDAAQTRVKVTEAAYQTALENVQSLRASLQERRAAFELAQKKLRDTEIRTPVAGTVSERLVQPGEFIRENTPVVGLVQMNPLKLRTGVQERYAALIRPGQSVPFRVEPYPDRAFVGKVINVSPAVDQSTRTFTVEILVENPERVLKPGFFAKGVILTQRDENVLAIPEEAISTLAGVTAVFVEENHKVRQQVVSLGAREGRFVEVISGLKGGETLASSNLSQLATGVSVHLAGEPAAGKTEGDTPAGKRQEGQR